MSSFRGTTRALSGSPIPAAREIAQATACRRHTNATAPRRQDAKSKSRSSWPRGPVASWRSYAVCMLGACILLPGCKMLGLKKKAPASQPAAAMVPPPQIDWSQAPVAAPPVVNRPIKEGTAPLVYLVEADAVIRVMDLTDNLELLSMPVMARQIVSVNPESGVHVGGAIMKPMRLSPNHRYAIYILNSQENITRTGRVRPGSPYSPPAIPGGQP